MFKHLRKLYWKSRDRGHEIRFMLIYMTLFLALIAGASVITCSALGISVTISRSDTESESRSSIDITSKSEPLSKNMNNSDISESFAVSGADYTLSVSGSASTVNEINSVEPTADRTNYDVPLPSPLPGQISSPVVSTPSSTSTSEDSSVDVSSLEKLLSFMSDSAYEDLKSQVMDFALNKASHKARYLENYQDIGESDFDVIKYVALDDGSVLACRINLDRGGVSVSMSDKTEAILKKEAKTKDKAAKSIMKKKTREKKSKSRKIKHKQSKKHKRSS